MKIDLEKTIQKFAFALTVLGIAVSIYMTIYKLTDNNSMCLGSGDCSTVNASKYSEFYGLPVGLIGVVGYLGLFFTLYIEKKFKITRENGNLPFFAASLLGFAFTLYLIFIEIWVLDAICPFCLISQVTMSILFFIALYKVIKNI